MPLQTVMSLKETYKLSCDSSQCDQMKKYIDAVDAAYPNIVRAAGVQPLYRTYHVSFGDRTGYAGGGKIQLKPGLPQFSLPLPACLDGALVFETIHGLLEVLRHPPTLKSVGQNRLDESFSAIVEIAFLDSIGLRATADKYREGKGFPSDINLHRDLVQIYTNHGIAPFHKLFASIHLAADEGRLALDTRQFGEGETPAPVAYRAQLSSLISLGGHFKAGDILMRNC